MTSPHVVRERSSGTPSVRVTLPGLLSTIQACGRRDVARYGIAPSGPADWWSARAANLLAGNDPCAALIETTMTGIAFEMLQSADIAVTGAVAALDIDGAPAGLWRSHCVRAGAQVRIGSAARGLRSYVAFGGGLDIPRVLGSESTDLTAALGGLEGHAFRVGDLLAIREHPKPADSLEYPEQCIPAWQPHATLRVVRGPHARVLSEQAWSELLGRTWTVSSRSTRQAAALEGEPLPAGPTGVISAGACAGCVQVTSAGLPLVLLCEHQTTAGYALTACVISADLPRAAQARPGDRVRFRLVTQVQAAQLREAMEGRLAGVRRANETADLAAGFFEGL